MQIVFGFAQVKDTHWSQCWDRLVSSHTSPWWANWWIRLKWFPYQCTWGDLFAGVKMFGHDQFSAQQEYYCRWQSSKGHIGTDNNVSIWLCGIRCEEYFSSSEKHAERTVHFLCSKLSIHAGMNGWWVEYSLLTPIQRHQSRKCVTYFWIKASCKKTRTKLKHM